MTAIERSLVDVDRAVVRCQCEAAALGVACQRERSALLAAVRDLEVAAQELEAAARAVRWAVNHCCI